MNQTLTSNCNQHLTAYLYGLVIAAGIWGLLTTSIVLF
jgi:hypothetical protein